MNYKNIFIKKNLNTVNSFLQYVQNNFLYGWIDQDGNKHYGINDAVNYSLQTPEELMTNQIGNCWDITELCRCFFENMTSLYYETYYIYYEDNKGCPSHSILIYYDQNKVFWFEPMFNDDTFYYSGIHEYNNILELLDDVKKCFIKYSLLHNYFDENYNPDNIYIYKYSKPEYHINGYQMREHINNSIKL